MAALVISAFPACGKTHFYENSNHLKVIDSDSSAFSWIVERRIGGKRIRNPEFPSNYINHIKNRLYNQDVILVSSHDVVRKALKEDGVEFAIMCPRNWQSCKLDWIERCILRGNDNAYLSNLVNNWDRWINEIAQEQEVGIPVVWLSAGEYLSDKIGFEPLVWDAGRGDEVGDDLRKCKKNDGKRTDGI